MFLRVVGAGRYGLPCAIGVLLVWLLFRNATITLDSHGFTYHSIVQRVTHAWTDIERFSVVEQRMLGFITISHYLGYNFSPAYKHYRLIAIPRAVARVVGMTHAMFKPVGFHVPSLTAVMNDYLNRARAANSGEPRSAA